MSYGSGSAEADGDLDTLHDDRHITTAFRVFEHVGQGAAVFLNVLVFNCVVSFGVILTGRRRVVSGVLAEYHNFVCHELSYS